MRTFKKGSAAWLFAAMGLAVGLTLNGCGGSSGGSTTAASADSLSDLPATSTLVTGGSASASISAKSVGKAAAGTPPLLKDISSSNIDTYFWNGLLATLYSTDVSAITEAQSTAYWQGEGACRMAQAVGYAFQNISTGAISLCYMQNAPLAANGVSITSGSATATNIFDQAASNRVVKVATTNFSMGGDSNPPENIFIRVYGTGSSEGSSGFAADLWFCSASSSTPVGYEQIRVNNSTGAITTTSVHSDFGNFVASVSGFLTTNTSGQFVFDSTKTRAATIYFGPRAGNFTFLGSVSIDSSALLTARDYWTGTFGGMTNTNKHAVFSNYIGSTFDTLRFSDAAFALQDTFGSSPMTITDATEYSTTHYANVSSGTLLTTARAERFDADLYSGTSSTQYSTAQSKLSAVSGFSCSETPDVIVAMDFSQSGPQAVATQCEPHFANMNFCDGSVSLSGGITASMSTLREKIFANQALQGACSTSFCKVGDDFSCQMWADDHPGNAQGITTANARCSNTGCCTTQ